MLQPTPIPRAPTIGRIAAKRVDRETDVSSERGIVLVTERNILLRYGKSHPSVSANKRFN
jgi:hypothetical protein